MFGRRSTPPVIQPVASRPAVPRASASAGQQEYEARRAAKAGMSVEKWRESRDRARKQALAAVEAAKPRPARPRGLLSRLIDRAHKPL